MQRYFSTAIDDLADGSTLIIGIYSSTLIPREEEPQIDVPIADIFVGYPGASPTEVESRIAKPLEN
ncbi:MAG: hypothetical protein R2788_02415 [Saprospiraceae bacterium]